MYGPWDFYIGLTDTELENYRQHAEQLRRRAYGTVGYALPGGTTFRFDLGFTDSHEHLPGSLTQQELETNPKQADPTFRATGAERNYEYTRGAFTARTPLGDNQMLEWLTQLNYQDLDHPLPFAIIDDTTYAWSSELRWTLATPLFGTAIVSRVGLQYAGTRQNDDQFQNLNGNRGLQTENQINSASNYAIYAEDQFDVTPNFTVVAGLRGQYAVATRPRPVRHR